MQIVDERYDDPAALDMSRASLLSRLLDRRMPMRILVPVDGSDSANRTAAHAVALVRGRADAEIILLNVQNQRTLDISDISRVTSVGANAERAADKSKQHLLRRLRSVALHRLSSKHARRSVSSQI